MKKTRIMIDHTLSINNTIIPYHYDADKEFLGMKERVFHFKISDFHTSLPGTIQEWGPMSHYLLSLERTCPKCFCDTMFKHKDKAVGNEYQLFTISKDWIEKCEHYDDLYMSSEDIINVFENVCPDRLDEVKMLLSRIESFQEFLKPINKTENRIVLGGCSEARM